MEQGVRQLQMQKIPNGDGEEPATVEKFELSDAIVEAIAADDVAVFEALEPRLSEPLFPPPPAGGAAPGFWRRWLLSATQQRLSLYQPLHLAVQLCAVRIFAATLAADPELLGQREPDGATLLHTLARWGPRLPAKAAELMEDAAVRALAGSSRGQVSKLLLAVDSCGLRPLEACVKFGSYRLARQLLHLPGYLMEQSWRRHGWEVRRYCIAEYDLVHGERSWLSLPCLLTYVCHGQVAALKASQLARDPLVRAWARRVARQTRLLTGLRVLVTGLPSYLFLLTIVVGDVQKMVSSFCLVVHCNRAANSAAATVGINASQLALNLTAYYVVLEEQTVKGARCGELQPAFSANKMMLEAVVAVTTLSLAAKLFFGALNRRRNGPIFAQRRESLSDCFIRRWQFDVFHLISVLSGALLVVLAEYNFNELNWYTVLYPSNSFKGLVLEQAILGSTGCFIIFTLLYFGQYMEIVSKTTGKLFFTFQCMNSSFMTAIPLLFYWLIMFSLVFYSVVDTTDFASGTLSTYSSVKIVLNMVTFPLDNTVALLFHALFFMFIGLIMLNFLIAFVNETFQECNSDFELAYWLLRLHTGLKTFRYCQWLLRLPHWLEAKRTEPCGGAEPIEICQPTFKEFNFTEEKTQ